MGQLVSQQEAQFYDIAVSDWPGEIDFYRAMAIEIKKQGGTILEVGCGTGRVTLRLAHEDVPIVGLDFSPDMLAIARQKSQMFSNVRWVEGDMRVFDLQEHFDLIIIPGHSFQFMLTPHDQKTCLESIRHHLAIGGKLVVHLNHDDPGWLGSLNKGEGTDFELAGEYHQESMGYSVRQWNAWSYEASSQTASVVTAWETIGEDGSVIERWESVKKKLHCAFRFEMEHLFARTGFKVEALYGDFSCQELHNTSPEMVWIASVE